MRHRDIHLLTVGRYTYTSDQRFEAMHSPHAEEWTLRIRYAQRKDSGVYECQISTTPPIGHFVFLNVVGNYSQRICKINFAATGRAIALSGVVLGELRVPPHLSPPTTTRPELGSPPFVPAQAWWRGLTGSHNL